MQIHCMAPKYFYGVDKKLKGHENKKTKKTV